MDSSATGGILEPHPSFVSEVPPHSEDLIPLGTFEERTVEKAEGQTSRGWFVVAMVIGALMVVGAGFGTLGLLHSYGMAVPQLLQPMASAIGSIGPEALWGLTVGGGAIGLGLIVWGAYKLYKDPTRFGDRFSEFGFYKPCKKNYMDEHTYKLGYFNTSSHYLIRCAPSGVLECTGILTEEEEAAVCTALEEGGYVNEVVAAQNCPLKFGRTFNKLTLF